MSNIFFTSDTHFGHANIIQFCHRPFSSTDEMNEALITNWNSVVQPDDTVYHLGDFCFGTINLWEEIRKRLNGHIHLILGNHDMKQVKNQARMNNLFDSVSFQQQINLDNRSVYLNHYPFLCYGGTYRREADAVWQLFGHVHSGPTCKGADTDRLANLFKYQLDVGVDNFKYTPVNWDVVKKIIESR